MATLNSSIQVRKLVAGSAFLFALMLAAGFSAKASEGHYETRYQTVLVSNGHYENRWVGPVRTVYGVIKAHYESYWVPPRYATRKVSVFVPDNRSSSSNSSEPSISLFKGSTWNITLKLNPFE